jgi:hypothetical protein
MPLLAKYNLFQSFFEQNEANIALKKLRRHALLKQTIPFRLRQ